MGLPGLTFEVCDGVLPRWQRESAQPCSGVGGDGPAPFAHGEVNGVSGGKAQKFLGLIVA
jgi:hypothetical protein